MSPLLRLLDRVIELNHAHSHYLDVDCLVFLGCFGDDREYFSSSPLAMPVRTDFAVDRRISKLLGPTNFEPWCQTGIGVLETIV